MDLLRDLFHRLLRALLGPHRFEYWQQRGFHVLPVGHYYPVPDTRTLTPALWSDTSQLAGIDMNEGAQLELLRDLRGAFAVEYASFPVASTAVRTEFHLDNPAFPPVDAKVLYGIVRRTRPRRITEIGAGFSTLLTAQALRRNQADDAGYACDFVTIDPFPADVVRAGVPGLSRLLAAPVQEVPLAEFTALSAGDILFIDSSHVMKIGSDVQYEILEILPRLSTGVLVHFHDIFFPFEYPREWIFEKQWFWNEQYAVQAFLACNDSYEVVWASTYMAFNHGARLEEAFASRKGASLWIRRLR